MIQNSIHKRAFYKNGEAKIIKAGADSVGKRTMLQTHPTLYSKQGKE